MSRKPLKHHLYVIIFGTHTPAGRAFDISLIVA
ncbi:MAG TPA: ion transporter, partial [Vibrio sp.]|nr:ion transporter [Vibrio sp.]